MAKKREECECPKQGLTAPFYMLTYGDLMTLLMCFFVLLFAMSTLETIKFQAQVSIMQGAMGITRHFKHSPMQRSLPAPAVKQTIRPVNRARVTRQEMKYDTEQSSQYTEDPILGSSKDDLHSLTALGITHNLQITMDDDEVTVVLPTFGIFRRGEWTVDKESPEVSAVSSIFQALAKQMGSLSDYDIFFVGHTDTIPLAPSDNRDAPKTKMELGFRRAVALYEFFFQNELRDLTRITFASQGDNIPIIPHAQLDSELRKNRRVQIHLKKKTGN